jgi:hypothetical protein
LRCGLRDCDCSREDVEVTAPANIPGTSDGSISSSPTASSVMSEEVTYVDPVTGGKKGQKPERLGLLPPLPLRLVSRVYGFGASKYDAWNWTRGYPWSLSIDALLRHVMAFIDRQEDDPESGVDHLAHAVFHCFTLMWFRRFKPEFDDRPPKGV